MKQHENGLNQKPLIACGSDRGRCWRVKLPLSNRTPVESAAKGQRWWQAKSSCDFKDSEEGMKNIHSRERLFSKIKTLTGNQGMMNLYTKMMLSGFTVFLVAAKFRKRTTTWLLSHRQKVRAASFHVDLSSHRPCDGINHVNHSKTKKPSCRTVQDHFGLIGLLYLNFKIAGKIPFPWQKTTC